MHVLIIGCGYLGRRAAQRWLDAGATVSALTRSAERAQRWQTEGIAPIVGDVMDPASLTALPAADLLLYAVGMDRSAPYSKEQVYVQGIAHVLQAAGRRVGRCIYISSTSVYGQSDGSEIDETSPTTPESDGGRICLTAEQQVQRFFKDLPAPATVLRLSGIYGPDRLLNRAAQLQTGRPLAGNPEAWLNLIHVDDAAAAVLRLAEVPSPAERYLLSDNQPIRRKTYYAKLASLIGAPSPTFANAEDAADQLGKRCVNCRIRRDLELTLQFPTIEEGLPDAVERT